MASGTKRLREDNERELKFHRVQLNDTIISTVGTITPTFCNIAAGDMDDDRTSRLISIRTIQWRYQIDLTVKEAVISPVSGDAVRLILYIDRQCNGATATVGDLLTIAELRSTLKPTNVRRFRILLDRTHDINYLTMSQNGANDYSHSKVVQNHSWELRCNIAIEYGSAAANINNIKSNNIGLLLISQSGTTRFTSRIILNFTDE